MTFDKYEAVKENSSFSEINLGELKKKKEAKRLVYFSDGILEEYSTDEELDEDVADSQSLVDPKSLPWVPYIGYLMWWLGSRTLAVCDYLGENLAWYLGITSPKFQYELEQYEKMAKEEEEFENTLKAENAGWNSNDAGDSKNVINFQPQVISDDKLGIKFDDIANKPTSV